MKPQHWPGWAFDTAVKPAVPAMDLDFVWRQYQPFVEKADAFCDVPVPFIYRQAYQALPQAKFVLLRRASAGWIKSVRHHCKNRALDALEQLQYRFIYGRAINRLDELSDRDLFYGYEHFAETAATFFISARANFITLEIDDPDTGPALARFLNFDQVTAFANVPHPGKRP